MQSFRIEELDKHIIQAPADSIHADLNSQVLQNRKKLKSGKLGALIGTITN